jgi:hypothetical protein
MILASVFICLLETPSTTLHFTSLGGGVIREADEGCGSRYVW